MNINFGENLKQLRHKKDFTQEQVADYLNVSPQSVSRWETNSTYPDIELLPVLANFYGVSADYLLGIDAEQNQIRVEYYLDTAQKYAHEGMVKEKTDIMREAVNEFPNNYLLILELQHALLSLGMNYDGKDRESILTESIVYGNRILSDCHDEKLHLDAIHFSALAYINLNQTESAKKYAEKLPDFWGCNNFILEDILKGKERNIFIQKSIQDLSDILCLFFIRLGHIYTLDDDLSYNANEKIILADKIIEIFKILYENNDYGFFHVRLENLFLGKAYNYATMENVEECINNLVEAVHHATKYESLPTKYRHSSLLFRDVEKDMLETTKNREICDCTAILQRLEKEHQYDFVRNDFRFISIVDELKQYVKK